VIVLLRRRFRRANTKLAASHGHSTPLFHGAKTVSSKKKVHKEKQLAAKKSAEDHAEMMEKAHVFDKEHDSNKMKDLRASKARTAQSKKQPSSKDASITNQRKIVRDHKADVPNNRRGRDVTAADAAALIEMPTLVGGRDRQAGSPLPHAALVTAKDDALATGTKRGQRRAELVAVLAHTSQKMPSLAQLRAHPLLGGAGGDARVVEHRRLLDEAADDAERARQLRHFITEYYTEPWHDSCSLGPCYTETTAVLTACSAAGFDYDYAEDTTADDIPSETDGSDWCYNVRGCRVAAFIHPPPPRFLPRHRDARAVSHFF
jgi:hypothetical protein